MKKFKHLKIVVIVVFITITFTFVAATNGGYRNKLFKPQISSRNTGKDNLYELLTSYEIWAGNGTGHVVTPDGDTIRPWASWVGTVRTAGGNKVITGTWTDDQITPPAYGGFTGNIDANGYVTNGIWWADNPQLPNSGAWQARFYYPDSNSMSGTWHYADQNGSGNGTMDGNRTQ